MQIVRIDIERFRSIRSATLFPGKHNVFLAPNNAGKTTILEALNLLLNPELSSRGQVVDENDFFRREYLASLVASPAPLGEDEEASDVINGGDGEVPDMSESTSQPPPVIRITAVIADLSDDDLREFSSVLVPWHSSEQKVVEFSEEGDDPFSGAVRAIRPCFEAWYDEVEDEFAWKTFFLTDLNLSRDDAPVFNRKHKRQIGFLIYRDFRGMQKPITLESTALFARLLASQEATPKHFESVLEGLAGSVQPLFQEANFARVVNDFRIELQRYLPLATSGDGGFSFEATDRSRTQVKAAAQLYVKDEISLPLQKMGAGTRSLAVLAMLLVIARKRGHGIIALEEPETFLFPHAQRRVIDEVLGLASQSFITTHSPNVLERMPLESFHRLVRSRDGDVTAAPIVADRVTGRQIRDRFRRQLSEVLLGRGAIVVEEESTRLWLLKASALLHGHYYEGSSIESLELQGVAVVTASGNGEVVDVGTLLRQAGLQVIGFLDQGSDDECRRFVAKDPELPLIFHAYKGLEELLLQELPRSLIRKALIEAGGKHSYNAAQIDGWSEDEFEKKAFEFLRNNKSVLVHEWILDQVGLNEMPSTFKACVALAGSLTEEGELTTRSLLRGAP
jgi:putative ATP-dependent endonuclease of OLD family